MPADQAAGLRRRSARLPLRAIHCFLDSPRSTHRLAAALHRQGWKVLLVDAGGRMFADSPARSLFDWRAQLERGQLHTLPLPHGDGWHAPGMSADAPALAPLARDYDCLLIDAAPDTLEARPLASAAHAIVLEVPAGEAALLARYAFLKSVSAFGAPVGLFGAAAACERLQAACRQFLDPAFAARVYSVAAELDAFAALAVRMAGEETGRTAPIKQETPDGW
jgi:hypothetical protein